MLSPIEFFDVADEYRVRLEIGNRTHIYHCRCDFSSENVVQEIYDDSGEIIATSMEDLARLGVSKATVIADYEVDLSEVF